MARGPAPATMAIAGVTAIIGLLITVFGLEEVAAVIAGFIPARLAGMELFPAGAPVVPAVLTPLSATLVHAGLIHLGFNLVMLLYTGRATEAVLGARGVLVLYLVGAYAAVAAQWAVDPLSLVPMVGASGAVSALVGAYSLFYGQSRARAIGPIPASVVHVLWLAAAWTVLNLLVGFLSARTGMPIAAAAHIGGFVAGLALARPLLRWRWRRA